MDEINNIFYKLLEGATKFISSSLRKTDEDPKLPTDEKSRKNQLYKQ